ncbi:THAP domain [Popillia japonica]|uniref:THAP domain n=1 Tax=Popillia japonica TaxID=7064 RepID=A0AAW1IWX8_POPJA
MDYYWPGGHPCCVAGCFDLKFSRYRIPVHNENIKKIWLERINNPALFKLPNKQLHNIRVCGLHFLPVCKRQTRLYATSLPTINLPGFSDEPNITNSFFKDEVMMRTSQKLLKVTTASCDVLFIYLC